MIIAEQADIFRVITSELDRGAKVVNRENIAARADLASVGSLADLKALDRHETTRVTAYGIDRPRRR